MCHYRDLVPMRSITSQLRPGAKHIRINIPQTGARSYGRGSKPNNRHVHEVIAQAWNHDGPRTYDEYYIGLNHQIDGFESEKLDLPWKIRVKYKQGRYLSSFNVGDNNGQALYVPGKSCFDCLVQTKH